MPNKLIPYRLTYATDKDTIWTEILATEDSDFSGVVNHAVLHLASLLDKQINEIKAFSVVILETKDETTH